MKQQAARSPLRTSVTEPVFLPSIGRGGIGRERALR